MNPPFAPHTLHQRVYYEDTDFSGLVYHANYLKFLERGRTEWLRQAGIAQQVLLQRGYAFVVTNMTIDFLASALMDDWLAIHTEVTAQSAARMEFTQSVVRRECEGEQSSEKAPAQTLICAKVRVAAINAKRKPVRLREILPDDAKFS